MPNVTFLSSRGDALPESYDSVKPAIDSLVWFLENHKLGDWHDIGRKPVCIGVRNPAWSYATPNLAQFIDGPEMYPEHPGMISFSGNFETFSNAFTIRSNDPKVILSLTHYMRKNLARSVATFPAQTREFLAETFKRLHK